MTDQIKEIQTALQNYNLKLSMHKLKDYLNNIQEAQQFFPLNAQYALIVKLLDKWEKRKNEKIVTASSEFCHLKGGTCVYTFGILGLDWPGLSNSCSGVINQMGYNIYFIEGFSIKRKNKDLGLVLIGVRTEREDAYKQLMEQTKTILSKLHQAAVGTSAKVYLISEEIRKLEMYGHVIAMIETMYRGEDLNRIIGLDGEAVKYFAARSRDYIENRKIEDIARQIILNYTLIKSAQKSGSTIEMDISNFTTKAEGVFTGVTVAGPPHMLNLEDCLKTIELTIPNYQLKHNREFTTDTGIALYRIEFVDQLGHPLSELAQENLKHAFTSMVLNKKRDRAQWIESIGGFEQYARAIIPLLVREAENTDKTQVYHSVGHATDLFIDFKIIVVCPISVVTKKMLVSDTVNTLEAVDGFQILSVKPPRIFGKTRLFIIDIRASLAKIDDVETVYSIIQEKIRKSLGEFRDFDEGMRTMDSVKYKQVRKRLTGLDKSLVRELYFGIEDFLRVSASVDEIIDHIHIAVDMLILMDEKPATVMTIARQTGTPSQTGIVIARASLLCISYPSELCLLQPILSVLESYDVTLSRLERTGRDILICRITRRNKALSDDALTRLGRKIKKLEAISRKPASKSRKRKSRSGKTHK